MRKIYLLFLAFGIIFLFSACNKQNEIIGNVVEVNMNDDVEVNSFVIVTDENEYIGILLTEETHIFSFVDGMTSDDFKKKHTENVIVSVQYVGFKKRFNMQDGKEISAYNAKQIKITGFLLPQMVTLTDGTNLELWQHSDYISYKLQNGIELLNDYNPIGPNNVFVIGQKTNFDDLNKTAQEKILEFYKNQGVLYNTQDELEKVYSNYLEHDTQSQFNSFIIQQEISPTSSNETMIYFITSVMLPYYEYRIGAAFNQTTGENISNLDLFNCSPETVIQHIMDISKINDPILRKEMEKAFSPEYIIVFPGYLEINFPRGSLPSQKYGYIISLKFDDDLLKILNEWAIPINND